MSCWQNIQQSIRSAYRGAFGAVWFLNADTSYANGALRTMFFFKCFASKAFLKCSVECSAECSTGKMFCAMCFECSTQYCAKCSTSKTLDTIFVFECSAKCLF